MDKYYSKIGTGYTIAGKYEEKKNNIPGVGNYDLKILNKKG